MAYYSQDLTQAVMVWQQPCKQLWTSGHGNQDLLIVILYHQNYNTMVPNRSEFSHGVWIAIFLFYCLMLSLWSFMGFNCIASVHVYIILLRNTSCRSSQEIVAGVISQWFWCKYPAHDFLLYSEGSGKKHRLSILKWNAGTYPLLVPGAVCLFFGGRKGSMTKHIEIQALPETYWCVFVSPLHAKVHT